MGQTALESIIKMGEPTVGIIAGQTYTSSPVSPDARLDGNYYVVQRNAATTIQNPLGAEVGMVYYYDILNNGGALVTTWAAAVGPTAITSASTTGTGVVTYNRVAHAIRDGEVIQLTGQVPRTGTGTGFYHASKVSADVYTVQYHQSGPCMPVNIQTISGDGATVTVATSGAHGFSTGHTIIVVGTPDYDTTTGAITVTGATGFTYASAVNAGSKSAGTVNEAVWGAGSPGSDTTMAFSMPAWTDPANGKRALVGFLFTGTAFVQIGARTPDF